MFFYSALVHTHHVQAIVLSVGEGRLTAIFLTRFRAIFPNVESKYRTLMYNEMNMFISFSLTTYLFHKTVSLKLRKQVYQRCRKSV